MVVLNNRSIHRLIMAAVLLSVSIGALAQIKANGNAAFYTGVYRNLFLEAGYPRPQIDKKLSKAYYDLFEGPTRVYFEVGDSMAYVSDIKNHEPRTEGLSYGMMIAAAAFRFDSWRVPMNITMDYVWYGKDSAWQQDYAIRFQQFLRSRGIDSFEDQFNLDGSRPEFILPAGNVKKLRHSLGLLATSASATLMIPHDKNYDFVNALWNAKLQPYDDGYFDPYYDGLLYLFSLMHLSGQYQIIKPQSH